MEKERTDEMEMAEKENQKREKAQEKQVKSKTKSFKYHCPIPMAYYTLSIEEVKYFILGIVSEDIIQINAKSIY
jgi:uncharacterized membrane protein